MTKTKIKIAGVDEPLVIGAPEEERDAIDNPEDFREVPERDVLDADMPDEFLEDEDGCPAGDLPIRMNQNPAQFA
jgi:hypothetical protein